MHAGEYLAVMQPNGHWRLYRINSRFLNGALDVTFVQRAEDVTSLLVRTRGIPVTLVGFKALIGFRGGEVGMGSASALLV